MAKTSTLPSFLALGCVGAVAFAGTAQAQEAEQGRKLGGMTVTSTAVDEPAVKVERAGSPKYTAPLADTPQTITVISKASIQQQNLLTLREVLSTVPGITFGAGEGGFGYGDRITLMGQDAKNDVTVDGVRSGAFLNRNETYNIEQVEVTNGANSVYNGGGSVAGTINLVTKKPLADNIYNVQAGIGTDNYYRGTVDLNRRINDLIAVRLNAVYHQNDVPGRKVEYFDRWGVAPAITIGIASPTSLTLQYEHLVDHSMPQYGVRYFPRLSGDYLPDFDREGYYGFRNVDKQNSDTDSIQAIFSHEFSDSLKLRNLSRYEDINQDTVTSQPNGAFCVSNGAGGGMNPDQTLAGQPCTTLIRDLSAGGRQVAIPLGQYIPIGGRGNQRFIRNETAYNQIDLIGNFKTGSVQHNFVLGASYLWEKYRQNQGSILRTADGYDPYAAPFVATSGTNPTGVNPLYNAGASLGFFYPYDSIGNPSSTYAGPINFIKAAQSNGTQESFAGYLFDTTKLTNWLEINGGIRFEHVRGSSYSITYSTTPGATLGAATVGATSHISNDLFSYRVGIVAKPLPNLSVYVAHGTSKLPSKGSVDGSCVTPGPGVTASNCTLKPETTKNYEIGVKANLLDQKLLLTAALFRNDRDQIKVLSGDPNIPDQATEGKQRSQGISLGASGNVGAFTISANYMYLDAYIRQGVSNFCLANPGSTSGGTGNSCTANSVAFPDPTAGARLTNAPEHSGSIFATYRFPFGLELGYGLTYQGKFLLNQPTLAERTAGSYVAYYVPSYLTQRLLVSYPVTDQVKAQVNVQNLFDRDYVTTVRNSLGNSWAQPGAARSAVFSLVGTF